jgi:hypothetical protein
MFIRVNPDYFSAVPLRSGTGHPLCQLANRLIRVVCCLILGASFATAVAQQPTPTPKANGGAGSGQKKPAQCELGPNQPRNWELLGENYVYFDYVLCPADLNPPQPLVRIWITTRGEGIAVENWTKGRDSADVVSMFHGKKKDYTLYRDLNAIPLTVFKAEKRSSVPADMAGQPFMAEGVNLVPLENLTSESADKVKKVFETADAIIKSAQRKTPLLYEAPKIGVIVDALDTPPKGRG